MSNAGPYRIYNEEKHETQAGLGCETLNYRIVGTACDLNRQTKKNNNDHDLGTQSKAMDQLGFSLGTGEGSTPPPVTHLKG